MRAVLVTGAGGSVGTALTARLTARGFTVFPTARGGALDLDVTDETSVQHAAKKIAGQLNGRGLHALVNNAGVIVQGPVELVSDAELRRQFEVNVFGAAAVMRAFLPLLRQERGRIVNISAPTARVAVPHLGPISASKAAMESLSDAARVELANWGIPVVLIEPGAMNTPIFEKAAVAATTSLKTVPQDLLDLYGKQLTGFGDAMKKQRLSPVDAVADTIVHALEARRPRPRYVVGGDARVLLMLAHLPTRLRDRLLGQMMGIAK
ncbi:SDR family NAD(P)-dependent oxidoreductase [Nonomuraea turcica]|uniref:SDR family NAD(P)-dependent oxidoreductase n=1 Tax=Nonomuraea sp. G32 TaxID=3067274 RepID=UPI00273B33F1|nr:SDR family NAD(P)-dependent oxidoreductase [Nonomuraea sp. G32]MDP4511548.1 SDR family NAD(P)-dependent oxidoreductase [Nonomuraea sp. G32]